jgi:hypothetical protein
MIRVRRKCRRPIPIARTVAGIAGPIRRHDHDRRIPARVVAGVIATAVVATVAIANAHAHAGGDAAVA